MNRYGRGRRVTAIFGGLLMLMAQAWLARPAAAADKAMDPVVREVVRMLEAKVAEPVIVRWLDTGNHQPRKLESDDLIALQKAGASRTLMEKLLDAAGGAAPSPPPPPAPEPKAAPQPELPAPPPPAVAPPPAPPVPVTVAPPPAPAAPTTGSAGPVKVRFDVQYKPLFGDEEDRWSMFVYLDGESLALSKPAAVAMMTKSLSFEKALAPGRHVVRVTQERHEKRHGKETCVNQARVAPAVLAFDLAPGADARVEIQLNQIKLRSAKGGPVSFTATQGDRSLARLDQVGGAADHWPALCEEVESNLEAGKEPSSAARRELAGCVRWNDLWPGITPITPREKVRAALAQSRFQPLTSQESGN